MTVLHIWDLLDLQALDTALEDGYVREQHHPTLPLRILNYTEKAQYERAWNGVTLNCRGLIVDDTGKVVARPFQKFFNYSEHPEGTFDLTARVTVTDKLDGSLGILYPTPDGHAIATRGSFTSDQAQHATKLWQDRYAGTAQVDENITWLFEIIYPENRIVCDYGGADDLFLLGGVHHRNGVPVAADVLDFPGPKVTRFSYGTLAEALTAPPRPGAEGIVICFAHDATLVKVKQTDYLRMHALVTGTSTRSIWELLAAGKPLTELLESVPDEFRTWVQRTAAELLATQKAWVAAAESDFAAIGETSSRKDFAARAIRSPYRSALFRLYDGREINSLAWKAVRPEYARAFAAEEEA